MYSVVCVAYVQRMCSVCAAYVTLTSSYVRLSQRKAQGRDPAVYKAEEDTVGHGLSVG